MRNRLTISIIIPAYNEEGHIGACLESIAAQTERPDEVIVVDNKSSDQTATVVSRFPFVRLIVEHAPGIIAARNAGFAVASGDILCRINADVELDQEWVKVVKTAFQEDDLAAITGPAITKNLFYDIVPIRTSIYTKSYLLGARAFFGVGILWGANMALRRSVWKQIQSEASIEDKVVHEDQDVSLLIAKAGGQIKIIPKMLVSTDEESYADWPKLKEYWARAFNTRAIHRHKGTFASKRLRRVTVFERMLEIPILIFGAWTTLYCLVKYYVLMLIRSIGSRKA